MEMHKPDQHGDSPTQPVDRMAFDMLRAIVSARQSATPTVRAVANRDDTGIGPMLSAIDLLNGRMAQGTPGPGPHAFRAGDTPTCSNALRTEQPAAPLSGEKQ